MEQELKALQLHCHKLMDLPNVVGVGIGPKMRAGMRSGETAVVVLVNKKMSEAQLQAESVVPAHLEGVATDIIEVGEIRLLGRTSLSRPAHPGASIGHYKVSAGTFGAVVYDRKTKCPLILSNNHILANITNGRDGRSEIGDPIYQPGSYDGGTSEDVIGNLYNFIPIQYETKGAGGKKGAANRVDAAVAQPVSPDVISSEIIDIGNVIGVAKPEMNMKVKKSGRTSGLTSGRVRVMHTTLKVDMDDNRYAVFEDQIVTDMVSKPGDSGSLVVNENNEAVGLLFAGSDRSAIFTPIQNVLDALKVTLATSQSPPLVSNPSAPAPSTSSPTTTTISPSITVSVLLLLLLLFVITSN
jgi:hypothetical protein